MRAELVALAERTKGFNAQAKAVQRAYRTERIRVAAVSIPASADADRLSALANTARAELARAEQELSRRIAQSWTDSAAASERGTAADHRPAGAHTVRAQHAPAPADRTPKVRAAAVTAAEEMLERDSPACEAVDLDRFAQQLGLLRQARTVDDVRRISTDLAASVTRSVVRRSQAERVAVTRQLLLDQLDGADAAADPAGLALRARVLAAPDPSRLEEEIAHAVARANLRTSRVPVARAVRDALLSMDYEVGEEFEDLLTGAGEVIVPFRSDEHDHGHDHGHVDEHADERVEEHLGGQRGEKEHVPVDGYGLRVTLSADSARLTTAVVRQDSARTPQEAGESDLQVQQWFCAGQSGAIEDGLQTAGVALRRTSVLSPGMMPAATVTEDRWPRAKRRSPRKQSTAARQVRNEERQRER